MCGLVGIFGNISIKDELAFKNLLIVDVIRGPHSTGVAVLGPNSKKPKIIKSTDLPPVLLNSPAYKKIENSTKVLLMGHNRFATKGEITDKNAHPFQKKHITLAHNGTVHNYKEEWSRKIDSDSELLTVLIQEKGIKWTWEQLLGAATLTFYDSKNKTFNFITNGKRPFHFIFTKNQKSVIWASEDWMLRSILNRCGIEVENTLYYPKDNDLWTFKYDGKKLTKTSEKLPVRKYPVKPYKVTIPHNQRVFGNNYSILGWNPWYKDKTTVKKTYQETEGLPILSNQISFEDFMANPVLRRCTFCKEDLTEEFDHCYYLDDSHTVCTSCHTVAALDDIKLSKEQLLFH